MCACLSSRFSTELAPPYWIRIAGGIFIIVLRGLELNVEAIGKMDHDSSPVFRITADGVYEPSGAPWTAPAPAAVTIADLFDPEPEHWGLRGDPYLWQALRGHLSDADAPTSVDEVVSRLHTAFRELVGLDLAEDRQSSVYLAQFGPRRHVQRNDLSGHVARALDALARGACEDSAGGSSAPP